MREFTFEEKTFLNRINDGKGGNLYNLIDPWIIGVSFYVNTITKAVIIQFDASVLANKGQTFTTRLPEIQLILIQAVNLLKLFEDKGYLFSSTISAQIPNPFTFGQATINSLPISYTFPDERVSELIVKYSTQEIFVTPELNKFINDGFITREEVRANRQFKVTSTALKTTRRALIITTSGVLLTLAFNIYNTFIKNSTKAPNHRKMDITQCKNSLNSGKFEDSVLGKIIFQPNEKLTIDSTNKFKK